MILPIIYCRGGLGNQLFLFSFYISLAKLQKYTAWDTSTLYRNDTYGRSYELDSLLGENSVLRRKVPKQIGRTLYTLVRILQVIFKNRLCSDSDAHKLITSPRKRKKQLFYLGYAQDCRIPLLCEDELNNLYYNSPYYSVTRAIFLERFTPETIAIHIRNFSGEYSETLANYIDKSLEKYKHNKAVNIIVFTDDKSLCNQYLSRNINFAYYSDIIPNSDGLHEFMMLSHFKNIIISNSTFSWWAAFLGDQNRTKNVVAPSHRVASAEGHWDPSMLLLPYWHPV